MGVVFNLTVDFDLRVRDDLIIDFDFNLGLNLNIKVEPGVDV